jgi:hypothetical protein
MGRLVWADPKVRDGFAFTIGVSLFTSPPEGAGAEFEAVKEAVRPVFRSR